MRCRRLNPIDDDMQFGHGSAEYHIDSAAGVAQSVKTRLRLWLGEWWLEPEAGMPWQTEVLGERTAARRDAAIRRHILETQGVLSLVSYSSQFDPALRSYSVQAEIETIYGTTVLQEAQ